MDTQRKSNTLIDNRHQIPLMQATSKTKAEGAPKKHMNNRNNNQPSKNLNGHTEQKPTYEKLVKTKRQLTK